MNEISKRLLNRYSYDTIKDFILIKCRRMRTKEVLRLLRVSKPTLYRYRKETLIKSQKLPSGFNDNSEEDAYRLVNKGIQRKAVIERSLFDI